MNYIQLGIDQLSLDLENPRFGDAVGSQREALQRIITDQKEKLANLAATIAADGLSPIDIFLVLNPPPTGGLYTVLEGNRRLAALKILANPTLLSGLIVDPTLQRRFERISGEFDRSTLASITCFPMENREDARWLLFLRHNGENGGKGLTKWSSAAANAFRGKDPSLQALDFVLRHGGLTQEQIESINERFPITTLDRLLSSRDVRQKLGLSVTDKKLETSLPIEEIIKPLRRMVLDLVQQVIRVDAVKTKQRQIDYINGFDAASKPDFSKAGAVRRVEDYINSEPQSVKTPTKPPRTPQKASPADRHTLIPRGTRLNIQDAKIAAIYKELKKLRVDEYPHAVSVLLRVFLELSVDHFLEGNGGSTKTKVNGNERDKSLAVKIQEGVDLLVAQGANRKDFGAILRGLSVVHSPIYVDLLHSYIHNRFTMPKERDLLNAWDEAQRFFDKIWI